MLAIPGCIPSAVNGIPSRASVSGVAQVAGQRERHSGPDGGPVDGRDGGHLEVPDREPGPVERQHPLAQAVDGGPRLRADPRDVPARAERAALPRDDHRPDAPVGPQGRHHPPPRLGHPHGHGVAAVGQVQRDEHHAALLALDPQVSEGPQGLRAPAGVPPAAAPGPSYGVSSMAREASEAGAREGPAAGAEGRVPRLDPRLP